MSTTEALGYIDKTIDNVIDVPDSQWRSDEVIELLRELRGMIVTEDAHAELVERAAVAMYFEDCGNTPDARERSTDEFDAAFRQMAAAALAAALGGGS